MLKICKIAFVAILNILNIFFDSPSIHIVILLHHYLQGMKKRVIFFSFVLFFLTLCVGHFTYKAKTQPYSDLLSKIHLLQQKSDEQSQPEIYSFSDTQDVQDSDDWEKVKYDYSILSQQWLHYFFTKYTFNTPVAAVQNRIYITAPRYILYHSLQVAGC